MRAFFSFMLLLAGISLAAAPARAERRIALVIGNDAYAHVTPLERAVADARSYRDTLSATRGFEVVFAENADRQVMVGRVGEFLGRIQRGDVAMVVFSGHGVQLDPNDGNTLYLLPTDVPSVDPGAGGAEFFLDSQAINFARLAEQVTFRGASLRVFVLDACRNNPFPKTSGGRSVGLTRGLGRIGANDGEFVFFAAAPGELALDYLPNDEASKNSVFTRVFLKHFTPGTYLEDIANDVQAEVLELSRQASYQQRPYYSDGVAGKACLDDACGTQTPAATVATDDLEGTYWRLCETRDTASYCRAYLDTFPEGPHALLARLRIDELEGAASPAGEASQSRVVTLGTASQTAPQTGAQPGAAEGAPEPEPVLASVDPAVTPAAVEPGGVASPASQNEADLAWTRIEASWDIRAIRAFRDAYPDAEQGTEADRRIDFLRARHAEAQAELNRLGYDAGPVDGDWGRRSAAALGSFQSDHGLARDGTVGPDTVAALRAATPRVAAAPAQPRIDADAGAKALSPAQPAPAPDPEPKVAALPPAMADDFIDVIVTTEFRRGDPTCPSPRTSSPVRIRIGPDSQPVSGNTGWLEFRIAHRDDGGRAMLDIRPGSNAKGQDRVSVPVARIAGGAEVTVYSNAALPSQPNCGTINFYVRKK